MEAQRKNKFELREIPFYGTAFLIGIALYAVTHLETLLQTGGVALSMYDTAGQLIPFYFDGQSKLEMLGRIVEWSWTDWLGNNYIGFASYYYLFSPYFWISLFFDKMDILTTMTFLNALKFAVAMFTFTLYLRKLGAKPWIALTGGILYLGSGPFVYNEIYFMFHDVMSLFPLVLFGLEVLLQENRGRVFAASILLLGLLNFYFLYFISIFSFLYFVLRFFYLYGWKGKEFFVRTLRFFLSYGAGLLTVQFSFLPSVMHVLSSPRIGRAQMPLIYESLQAWWSDTAAVLSAAIYPPAHQLYVLQTPHSIGGWETLSFSVSVLFVLTLPQLFFLFPRGKRRYLTIVLLLIAALITSPFLQSALSGFSHITYRWGFTISAMMIVGICTVLQHSRRIRPSLLLGTCVLFIILSIAIHFSVEQNLLARGGVPLHIEGPYPEDIRSYLNVVLIPLLLLTAFYTFLLVAASGSVRRSDYISFRPLFAFLIIALVCVECSVNYKGYRLFSMTAESKASYVTQMNDWIKLGARIGDNSVLGRTHVHEGFENASFFLGQPVTSVYNSTYSQKGNLLMGLYFEGKEPEANAKHVIKQLPCTYYSKALLSVSGEAGWIRDSQSLYYQETEDFIPLGLSYQRFLTMSEFAKLDWSDRDIAMVLAFVIPDEKKDELLQLGFSELTAEEVQPYAPKEYIDYTQKQTLRADGELYYQIGMNLFDKNDLQLLLNGSDISRGRKRWYSPGYASVAVQAGDEIELIDKKHEFPGLATYFMPYEGSLTIEALRSSDRIYQNVEVRNESIRFTYPGSSGARMLYLSVPNVQGWTARINGEDTTIHEIQGEMIGLLAKEGDNEVELIYHNPYKQAGIVISITTMALLFIFKVIKRKKRTT